MFPNARKVISVNTKRHEEIFGSPTGSHSCAIALAILLLMSIRPFQEWTEEDMLSAMHIGAIFHLDVMTNNYAGVHHNLLARELPICDIRIDDNNFSVNYHNEDIAGIIGPRITIGLGDNPTSAQLNIMEHSVYSILKRYM